MNWTKEDLDNLDRRTRKPMTMHNVHHPKACVERLYLPRAKGGRGLISARDAVEEEVSGLRSYIDKVEEPLLQNFREDNLVQKPKDDETTHSCSEARLNSWRDKPLHGKFLPIAEGNPKKQKEISSGSLVANLILRLKP